MSADSDTPIGPGGAAIIHERPIVGRTFDDTLTDLRAMKRIREAHDIDRATTERERARASLDRVLATLRGEMTPGAGRISAHTREQIAAAEKACAEGKCERVGEGCVAGHVAADVLAAFDDLVRANS